MSTGAVYYGFRSGKGCCFGTLLVSERADHDLSTPPSLFWIFNDPPSRTGIWWITGRLLESQFTMQQQMMARVQHQKTLLLACDKMQMVCSQPLFYFLISYVIYQSLALSWLLLPLAEFESRILSPVFRAAIGDGLGMGSTFVLTDYPSRAD